MLQQLDYKQPRQLVSNSILSQPALSFINLPHCHESSTCRCIPFSPLNACSEFPATADIVFCQEETSLSQCCHNNGARIRVAKQWSLIEFAGDFRRLYRLHARTAFQPSGSRSCGLCLFWTRSPEHKALRWNSEGDNVARAYGRKLMKYWWHLTKEEVNATSQKELPGWNWIRRRKVFLVKLRSVCTLFCATNECENGEGKKQFQSRLYVGNGGRRTKEKDALCKSGVGTRCGMPAPKLCKINECVLLTAYLGFSFLINTCIV